MRIGFISCVKTKRTGTYKAKDLYISDFFKKSLKYAQQNYDKVYILSAKYGLIELDTVINNYNETLIGMPKNKKYEWYIKTAKQINDVTTKEDELYFLTGINYYQGLLPLIKCKYHIVMEGLMSGQRLQWLNNNTKNNSTNSIENCWE